MAKSPSPSATPAPAPTAGVAVVSSVPLASSAALPAVSTGVKVTSGERPTHEVSAQSLRQAQEAFFKLPEEGSAEATRPTAPAVASATADADSKTPVVSDTKPVVTTEDVDGLVYEDPDAPASTAGDSGAEATFVLPSELEGLPAEFRAQVEKLGGNLHEQNQKLKRQRGEAQAETAKEKTEREKLSQEIEALRKAPTPVVAPELALPTIRTQAELTAFIAAAPELQMKNTQLLSNIDGVLKALEQRDEVTAFGRTFTLEDKEALEKQRLDVYWANQDLAADLKQVPEKQKWLEKRQSVLSALPKGYEDQFKAEAPLSKLRASLITEGPSLDAHPKAPILIGDHATMEMVRSGKLKLVRASPSASPVKAADAETPSSAGSRDATAPVPRSSAPQQDEDLRKRAREGDAKAQQELQRQFYAVEAVA